MAATDMPTGRSRIASASLENVPARERGVASALGQALANKVKASRVLLVGAGGIGCELLKNLVCCGFGTGTGASRSEIVLVDLDTIDLSNLNRQFLFRKQHIKKPKAVVAKDTASQFNPSVNIDAHHGSIFDDRYDVAFFEGFEVVFNALDNLAARRHVNKMCLAADVPLIESGTTGFNGQVQAIQKGITECYDCNPKPAQKSFPICTIRSTPSQPIHCIVWAKSYLLPELFGASDESSEVAVTDGDNAEEVAKLREEADALKKIRGLMGKSGFAQEVFNKVFHDDIERLRSMTDMWQSRRAPESLKFEALTEESAITKQGQTLSLQDQRPWALLENISVFCYSLFTLSKRAQNGETVIEFDKDDKDTLDFVASAANLRSHIFGIRLHSEWEIKQMAGNIIPAIATSNALTASLCTFEAFKILRSHLTQKEVAAAHDNRAAQSSDKDAPLGGAKDVFLAARGTERMMNPQPLSKPNPDCPVCSATYARLILPADGSATLQQVVDLLKERVGYDDFSVTAENVGMIYDPDLDDNLPRPLSALDIDGKKNIFLTVMDDGDEPRADLLLSIQLLAADAGPNSGLELLPSQITLPLKPAKTEPSASNGDSAPPSLDTNSGTKRKRGAEDDADEADAPAAAVTKKAKGSEEASGGVTVVDDDDAGGAILLDDD